MNRSVSSGRLDEWLSNPQRPTAAAVAGLVLSAWFVWTYCTQAEWFYQVVFLAVLLTAVLLIGRPQWFVFGLILLLVCDVTNYVRDYVRIPGAIGLSGLGNFKVPEIISLLGLFYLGIHFLMRPQDFRQPVVGRVIFFSAAGTLAVMFGVRRYVPTHALRDALPHYFVLFYVLAAVLFLDSHEARKASRVFFYGALFAVSYSYGYYLVTGSSVMFYTGTGAMFYSICAYVLLVKMITAPPGTRQWLTLVVAFLFVGGVFIGRTRSGVLFFLAGLVPILAVLPTRARLQVLGRFVVPGLILMVALFAWDAHRGALPSVANPYVRRIEVFTNMGSDEFDGSGAARLRMWRTAATGFLTSPLWGKGYGWTIDVSGEAAPLAVIHNSFLHVLACSGVIGFVPLLVVVFSYFGLCLGQLRGTSSFTKRLFCACAMAVGVNFFLTATTNVIFETANVAIVGWLLLGCAARIVQSEPEELDALLPYRLVEP